MHNGHTFIPLDCALNNAKLKVEDYLQTKTEINTPKLETIRNTVVERSSEYNEAIQTTIDVSRARFQTLRNDVDRVEKEWFQRIENIKADDNRLMIALERKLYTELKRRKEYTNICKSTLSLDNELALLSLASELKDEDNVELTEIHLPPLLNFKQYEYTLPQIQGLIGETVQKPRIKLTINFEQSAHTHSLLEGENTQSQQREISNNMNQSDLISNIYFPGTVDICKLLLLLFCVCTIILAVILSNMNFIHLDMIEVRTLLTLQNIGAGSIVHTRDDKFWTNKRQNEASILRLYDYNFDLINEIQLDFRIQDMVLIPNGNLIATDWSGQRVARISNKGDIKTLLDISPFHPCGLCMNDRQEIVLGLCNLKANTTSLVTYSGSDASMELRKIENLTIFDFYTYAIQQNMDGNYIVSGRNRTVCVTRDGDFLWTYESIDSRIFEVVCDRYDNVILLEYLKNKITMLSSDGKLIKTLMSEDDGVLRPLSLSIDRNDNLWIGQANNITIVRYIS